MEYIIRVSDDIFKLVKLKNRIDPINTVFNFIIKNYPVEFYPRVLEIAAGNGNLSELLAGRGYHVTAMDPKIDVKKNTNYVPLAEYFDENTDISSYDLGVAIHPCGIHKDIIKNFSINEKAFFIMPCYKITCDNMELDSYKNNDEWLSYLESLNTKMKRKYFFQKIYSDIELDSCSNAFYTKSNI